VASLQNFRNAGAPSWGAMPLCLWRTCLYVTYTRPPSTPWRTCLYVTYTRPDWVRLRGLSLLVVYCQISIQPSSC
jgi:hypothetical protein